jgi:hypothetical protein
MTDISSPKYMRRKEAAARLRGRYGWGGYSTLAKLAMTGDGPPMRKVGHMVLYDILELDAWAEAKISGPRYSTSESQEVQLSDALGG